ncbi:hypothetical protein [Piscirickettsia salmonis]|uniref:hypothetical protein n=1 Tax=Piscirickettsia salmonis TaxID=1238 RepID=UPI00037A0170|nr:hypothetical protein [Piscirickettsia salmonis]QHS24843.1 hypothetical protein GW538_01470 [Piscirickettsia salmonis]QHS28048.1 hypothetical protein GW537_01460 [Piscirickettsia salmonis]
MLGDFASLDVQNTYRGSDAYVKTTQINIKEVPAAMAKRFEIKSLDYTFDNL